jgi:EAL domain-containing protein (putative c-di-GMP-specific phosphodiesterase class I)
LEPPVALMSAAAEVGRLEELDWVCAAAAARTAVAARLHPSLTVFLNLEPSTLAAPCPPDLAPAMAQARERLRVVVEMGERSLLENPSGLLDAVVKVRLDGWGVAVDRVGADHTALAMLPFVGPDVLKLSLSLLKPKSEADRAETANAARAYAESTGAVTLVEGVETETDARLASTFGATYSQGWRYGRPAPLPAHVKGPHRPFPLLQVTELTRGLTPFELLREQREPEITEKRVLVPMSRYLEAQALKETPVVVLACFEHASYLAGETLSRYREIGSTAVFSAALAPGLRPERAPPGISAVELSPWDRLAKEWDVLVIGPYYAAAVVARNCDDGSSGATRRFECVVTYDRALVVGAARSLLHWMTGSARPQ